MNEDIRINTEEVNMSATSIEDLNKKLNDKLLESEAVIKALGQTWEGEAYDTLLNSYNTFAGKYFESYKKTIDDYVVFLREKVADGYFKTEIKNVELAALFEKK